MKNRAPTFIYFVAPVGGGPIKIGLSERPARRLNTFQPSSPYPLELLASAPGTLRDERAIHTAFIKHHSHGEWFKAVPEIYALINEVRATGSIPAAMRGSENQAWILPKKPITPEHRENLCGPRWRTNLQRERPSPDTLQ